MNGEVQKFEIMIRHQVGNNQPQTFMVGHAESDPEDTTEEIYVGLGKTFRRIASHFDHEWDGS